MNMRSLVRSIINRLPFSVLYELFYQSARALGVQSYEVNGSVGRFFGPVYDQSVTRVYLQSGSFSPNIVELFNRFFDEAGGTFYDVGGNIGLVCVPLASNPKIRVVSFEPDPHNCALLRGNIAINGVAVEVVNAAVADKPGRASFTRSDYNSGDHRLSSSGPLSVETVVLNDYPPGPGLFAVKIDTQGAEPLIFRGGEDVLAKAGLIVTEFWPWGMKRMGLETGAVLDFAQRHFDSGFVIRHGESIDLAAPLPMRNVLSRLNEVVAAGGEYDAVDLVLVRTRTA